MGAKILAFDVLIAAGMCLVLYLLLEFAQGPGIEFVYFAF